MSRFTRFSWVWIDFLTSCFNLTGVKDLTNFKSDYCGHDEEEDSDDDEDERDCDYAKFKVDIDKNQQEEDANYFDEDDLG